MKRFESEEDEMRGIITYELPNGRWVTFDARAVREYGIAELMRAHDLEQFIPTERLPVVQYGRRIGTMPADFDPANARSTSFLYDVRPGDFRREGDAWVVGRTLGAGDVDCVVGFVRDAPYRVDKTEVIEMEEVDKDKVIVALGDELSRCRELRAKLELQSMQAMDQLRAQIRALGAEPVL